MHSWQEDLLAATEKTTGPQELFEKIEAATRTLGFEYCAYGLRAPLPVSSPRVIMLNNYPQSWRERYAQADYLRIDPTVLHGRQSQEPLIWTDRVFVNARTLWDEARASGLRVGWAQSSLDSLGVGGMLTLSRSAEPLSVRELEVKLPKMRWLVHVSHMALARVLKTHPPELAEPGLTRRELEILKWTADGKSSRDIADILSLSKNTVDFHVKNAIAKLQSSNKTAAVVRAAMLGYLN